MCRLFHSGCPKLFCQWTDPTTASMYSFRQFRNNLSETTEWSSQTVLCSGFFLFSPAFHPPAIEPLRHLTCHCIDMPFPPFIPPFSLTPCLTLPTLLFFFLSALPTSSALRSCSTGDSLLSSASIRSAKSAPALAPPLPVLLHHHHPLLPPLADQLAGTHSLYYLPAFL